MDINVTGVWERNITGRGVTVVVVDDGVEHTHQDIQPNYVRPPPTMASFHAGRSVNISRRSASERRLAVVKPEGLKTNLLQTL